MFGNPNQPQPGALNLGASGGTPQPAQMNPFGGAHNPPTTGAFGAAMSGGMQPGMQPGMMQPGMGGMMQPAPPSDTEILMALLQTLAPIDRFITGAGMGMLLQTISELVSFSLVEILKNAKFKIDDDTGTMTMDLQSLPAHLQTVSSENVTNQFNALRMASQQNIQNVEMQRQHIIAFSQQSMMGGALNAALSNDGLMDKTANAAGTFMGRMMGMR